MSFRGLGRGHGFAEIGETSIIAPQDPITNQVKDRCLAIIAFLLKADCASLEEVYKALNIENPKGLREDIEALEVMFGDLKKAVVNIVDSIRENLDDEY